MACIDTLRQQLVRSAYHVAKLRLVADYRVNKRGCPYYNDIEAIVAYPVPAGQMASDPAGWSSLLQAGQCNTSCAGNLAVWMDSLLVAYTHLPLGRKRRGAKRSRPKPGRSPRSARCLEGSRPSMHLGFCP